MGVIRREELGGPVYRPVSMDLEDLRARGEAIKAQAADAAERIVREAHAERARILAGAAERGHAQGFERGHAEGLEKGREEGRAEAVAEMRARIDELEAAWRAALEAFTRDRDELLERAREDALELALSLARKVTKRAIACDPTVVRDQLRAVVELHARPTGLVVSVHPDDASLAREVLPALVASLGSGAHAELVVDPTLARGSCVARTDGGGVIDAEVDGQIDRLVADLLPRPARAEAGDDRAEPAAEAA